MEKRLMTRTNMAVSPIAFGSVKIGRNQKLKYTESFDLPSKAHVEALLNGMLDAGINLIDTAPAYGLSEGLIGDLISHRRDEFYLSTKTGEAFENGASSFYFDEDETRRSLDRSLTRLKTDYLDLVLIHSNGEDLWVQQQGVVKVLEEYKSQGVIGGIGISSKKIEGAKEAMNWADVLMLEYHLEDQTHGEVIRSCAEQGIGVLIKKGLGNGRFDPAAAIEFLLSNSAVSSVVIGSLKLENMLKNIEIATQAQKA